MSQRGYGSRVPANTRLSVFALVVVFANILAAALAVAVNWPSQFGGVGTDAGQELFSRGTAISAPLAPCVGLVLTAMLVRFGGVVGWFGIGLAFLTAVLVFVGGVGELVAEPTEDTPRAVLVSAGVIWCGTAVLLVVLGVAAARERLAQRDAS